MTLRVSVKNTKGVSEMNYIAKVNSKGVYSYLMTDGVFRPRPAYCKKPQSKYDLARAQAWKTFVWHNNNRIIADKFASYLMRGKRLTNEIFVTNGLID